MDSESRGELSWPLRLRVQLRCRRAAWEFHQAPKKRSTMGVPGLCCCLGEAARPGGFPVHKSCAPWHALSAGAGARSVPAPLLPAPPANQRRDLGAAPREPAPPPRSTAGFRTKGQGGGGGGRSVCFLPAGSVPATLGFSKSLAQGVWPSQTTLLVFYLSLAPVQSLSPYPEGDFGSR